MEAFDEVFYRNRIKLLLDRDGLTVVTNALNIANDLVANPGLRVFAAGGEVRSSSHESVRTQN